MGHYQVLDVSLTAVREGTARTLATGKLEHAVSVADDHEALDDLDGLKESCPTAHVLESKKPDEVLLTLSLRSRFNRTEWRCMNASSPVENQ